MLISLKDFAERFLYPGQLVEVSHVGPDEHDDDVRYEGNQDNIPESLYGAAVRYVAMNGRDDDPYTVRIECNFDTDVSSWPPLISDTLEHFVAEYMYHGQEIEVSGIGPDSDGNFVRYEGSVDKIPDELKQKKIRYIASAARNEASYTLRVECFF